MRTDDKYSIDFSKLKQKKQLIKQVALMYCSAQGPPEDAEDDDSDVPEPEPPVTGQLPFLSVVCACLPECHLCF